MTADARSLALLDDMPIEDLSIHTIRTLAMDAVEQAQSGHPGTPMALAPLAYALWTRVLKYNPANPAWFDRDRFVLSCGHTSMLQYAVLHLTGYDVTLDDLRAFRQFHSKTPGHPENWQTPGVETTTGPLGQGCMNSVGMAIAERHLAARFNQAGHTIIDHRTWVFCSDGDLMEGASHEAASLAGHLRLGKLCWVYDDNHITIDGSTALSLSDDVARRFEGYGWRVRNLGDAGNDVAAITAALQDAASQAARPSLIVLRTHIGYGAPKKQDSEEAHGAPLGEEEIRGAKRAYGWPEDLKFHVPERVAEHMRRGARERGGVAECEWQGRLNAWRAAFPDLAREFDAALAGEPPPGWEAALPVFPAGGSMATRAASGKVLATVAKRIPWFAGGSADLSGSNKTWIEGSGSFSAETPAERNVRWGVREHGMCGALNGMALHGGVRPYGATFLVFTDYARPAIRLSAIMRLPVITVMTHDSIGLGEDGPTHQPIEHLAALRAIPNLHVIRPADANETAVAWRAAIERRDGPTMLVLTRQNLPTVDRARFGPAEGLLRGAYVLSRERGERPDVVLIATGSEVQLAVGAQEKLAADGIDARVVSMPCWERFRAQDRSWRDEVLPPSATARLAVEAAGPFGWREWVGDRGDIVAMPGYGASAPDKVLFAYFGFTVENVAARARALLG